MGKDKKNEYNGVGIAALILLFGGGLLTIIGLVGLFAGVTLLGAAVLIIGAVVGMHNNSEPFRELLKFLSYVFMLVGFLVFMFNPVSAVLLLITGGITRILAFIIEPIVITFTKKK